MYENIKRLVSPSVLKFLVVGVVSFGVDFALLVILYRALAVQLNVATTIAFLMGLLINFTMNKYWTFGVPSGVGQSARQAALYGVLVVINLLFTNVFISSLAFAHLGPELSKPLATGVVMVTNYIVYQKIIFRVKPVV
jgi:putative flippase GtrA